MTSAANLAWLRQTERRYLVGTLKSELRKWTAQIADAHEWQTVRAGVEPSRVAGPTGRRPSIRAMKRWCMARSLSRRSRRASPAWPTGSPRHTGPWRTGRSSASSAARWPATHAPSRYLIEIVADASVPSSLRLAGKRALRMG